MPIIELIFRFIFSLCFITGIAYLFVKFLKEKEITIKTTLSAISRGLGVALLGIIVFGVLWFTATGEESETLWFKIFEKIFLFCLFSSLVPGISALCSIVVFKRPVSIKTYKYVVVGLEIFCLIFIFIL